MSEAIAYEDLVAFHPGTYVNDIIEEMELTPADFARRLNTSTKLLGELLRGQASLTKELAEKLSRVTGVSLGTWLNLQRSYAEKVLEIQRAKAADASTGTSSFPSGFVLHPKYQM